VVDEQTESADNPGRDNQFGDQVGPIPHSQLDTCGKFKFRKPLLQSGTLCGTALSSSAFICVYRRPNLLSNQLRFLDAQATAAVRRTPEV
jgi:hypothetical protein